MRCLAIVAGKSSSLFCSCTPSASRFSSSAIRPAAPSSRCCQAAASCSQLRRLFSAFLMASAKRDSACMAVLSASRAVSAVRRAAASAAPSAASSPNAAISASHALRLPARSFNVWSNSAKRSCAASAFSLSDSACRRISPNFCSAARLAARHSRNSVWHWRSVSCVCCALF